MLLLFIVLTSQNLLSNNGTSNQTEEGCETKHVFISLKPQDLFCAK